MTENITITHLKAQYLFGKTIGFTVDGEAKTGKLFLSGNGPSKDGVHKDYQVFIEQWWPNRSLRWHLTQSMVDSIVETGNPNLPYEMREELHVDPRCKPLA